MQVIKRDKKGQLPKDPWKAKRNMQVEVEIDGKMKTMRAIEWCECAAKICPVMTINATGKLVDHEGAIKRMYMEQGLPGVDLYLSRVNELIDAKNRIKMRAVRKIKKVVYRELIWQAIKTQGMRFLSWVRSWKMPLVQNSSAKATD